MHCAQMEVALTRIETPRLVLEEITDRHLAAYYALNSDLEVMRTWGTEPHSSPEVTRQLIEQLQRGRREGSSVRWGIFAKDGELLGDVGFWRFVKVRHRAEIGAKIAKAHWGRGYQTEAMAAVVDYGFKALGLNSVEANIDPTNPGAIRLVEKVGFVREGLLREHSYCPFTQQYRDTYLYTVLRSQWKS